MENYTSSYVKSLPFKISLLYILSNTSTRSVTHRAPICSRLRKGVSVVIQQQAQKVLLQTYNTACHHFLSSGYEPSCPASSLTSPPSNSSTMELQRPANHCSLTAREFFSGNSWSPCLAFPYQQVQPKRQNKHGVFARHQVAPAEESVQKVQPRLSWCRFNDSFLQKKVPESRTESISLPQLRMDLKQINVNG